MALSSLLIQRSLNSFSVLRRSLAAAPAIAALSSSSSSSLICVPLDSFSRQSLASSSWQKWPLLLLQSRQFRSSPVWLSSSSSLPERRFEPSYTWSYEEFKPRELGIDEIAGCDFNHWLIVVDFPKNPRPSPEEMVRSYGETCAKALNISVEVAKKKIYACSTSNYTGFHVEATEVESEKFNGQPGVVFVLPDSYVDPERKEYGGDKYINGVIIPRPRTTLNGRRNQVQPKHDQQGGPMPNQKGNPSFSHESPPQGGSKPNRQRNSSSNHQGLSPQSLPSKESYNLPGQGERKGPPNYPSQQNHGQPGLREVIVPQKSHDRPALGETRDPQNYSSERNYDLFGQGDGRDIVPTVAPRGRNGYQEGSRGLIPSYPRNYNQEGAGNIYAQEQRVCLHGEQWNYASPRQQGCPRDDCRFYCPPQGTHYGQGVGGYQVQGAPESYWQAANSTDDYRFYGLSQGTHYGQGVGGYQVQGAPESYWQGSTDDCRFYGRPQGTRYGQGVGGYQVHGAQESYRQGANSRDDYRFYGPQQGLHYGQRVGRYQVQGAPESYWQGANSRDDYRFYGPPQDMHYGQGVGGDQVQGAPESYWQGANSRDDYRFYGPPQDMHYGQGVGGYQVQGAPESYWQGANSRDDYRFYGPPQDMHYGQGAGGYQVQGAPESYWRGANCSAFGQGTSFGYGQGYPKHIQGHSFSQQEQTNEQCASFYPQEQREFVQGYQINYALPGYERGFSKCYGNYGLPQRTPYGHGAGEYQSYGASEARQGESFRAVGQGMSFSYGQGYSGHIKGQGFSREQPRNMQQGVHYYSLEEREFPQGGQANYAPPRHHGGFREYQNQNYGRGQGTPSYGQVVDEYQGYGTHAAYWHGLKY